MGLVRYDGNRIEPAPTCSINRSYIRANAGQIIGSTYQVAFNGWILADRGSPNSSGVWWNTSGVIPPESIQASSRLSSILTKQRAFFNLFGKENHGKVFEIQSDDASQPFKFNAYDLDVNFEEGIWYDYCRYTINCNTRSIQPFPEPDFSYYISSASESWSIENNETPENLNNLTTFRVSHAVSAQGQKRYDADGSLIREGWQEAKLFVNSLLGFNPTVVYASGVNNVPGYLAPYNHVRAENLDIYEGSYSVSENWILTSGAAIEEFNIDASNSNSDGLTKVSITGSVNGLEQRDSNMQITTSKFQNASGYFNTIKPSLLNRAQQYAGITLNPVYISESIGRNPLQGTISYSYEYDNRPTSLISGAKSESINVSFSDESDSFASVFVLGRSGGPVLQPLQTSEAKSKSLNIEAVLGPSYNPANMIQSFRYPDNLVSGIVYYLDPLRDGARVSYKSQPQKTWEPFTGRLSYSITWTYE